MFGIFNMEDSTGNRKIALDLHTIEITLVIGIALNPQYNRRQHWNIVRLPQTTKKGSVMNGN